MLDRGFVMPAWATALTLWGPSLFSFQSSFLASLPASPRKAISPCEGTKIVWPSVVVDETLPQAVSYFQTVSPVSGRSASTALPHWAS